VQPKVNIFKQLVIRSV